MLKLISCSVSLNYPMLEHIKILQVPEECLNQLPVTPIIKNGRVIFRYAQMVTNQGACIGIIADTEAQELKPILLRYEIKNEQWQMLIFCPGGVVCMIQSSYIKDLFYALFYECIYDRYSKSEEDKGQLQKIIERVSRAERKYLSNEDLNSIIGDPTLEEIEKAAEDDLNFADTLILPNSVNRLSQNNHAHYFSYIDTKGSAG